MGLFKLSSPTLVGLDIGSDRLKVVEWTRTGRTFHLARMASAPSPSSAFRDGVPTAPDEVGAQIRALMDKAGIRPGRVGGGAGGQNVTVREVRVPPMTAQELTAAVRYEAERYLPYNVQDVHMDYQVRGETSGDGRKMLDVIVVATRRDVVQRLVETVRAARLQPVIMDVESFALFRSLVGNGTEARTVVYIDLGAEASDIVITEGKRLRLTRHIPIGGNTLIHALQETLSVDAATAKTMLEERGEILDENIIPDDLTVQRIHDTIAPQIGDLVTEIRRSLDYYQTRARAAVVSQIVLTGGLARLKNLSRGPAGGGGARAGPGRPLFEIGLPLVVLVAVVAFYLGLSASVARIQGDIKKAEDEIKELTPQVQAVEDLKKRIEEARKKEDLLAQLLATQLPASAILTNIRVLIPKDVWLTTLSVPDTRSFTLEGFGMSYVAVARLMDNLESAGIFEGLDLTSAERDRVGTNEVVKYSVNGRLVRPSETPEGHR